MGGRAGGGAAGGMGSRSRAGRTSQSFMTLQGGRFGNVTINSKKSPQQVLKQANKLWNDVKKQTGGMEFDSLIAIGLYGKSKAKSWAKIKAAQTVAKIAKGSKVGRC